MSKSRMMFGSPLLAGDNTIPGLKIHKEVKAVLPQIEAGCRRMGLDYYPIIVEYVTYDVMSELASYNGFPVRYPHWRFGMEYEEMSRGYEFNQYRISEMVINANPCYIYVMDSNTLVDSVDVIVHAIGHCDFFKNNIFFQPTDTGMVNKMANHGTRIRKYMDRWGYEVVTEFIDHVLRIDTLIDPAKAWKKKKITTLNLKDERHYEFPDRLKSTNQYMDGWVNPKSYIDRQHEEIKQREAAEYLDLFEEPVRDIFGFIKDNAPLKPWQQDITSILYEEALYFAPQRATKATNEGWACVRMGTLIPTENGLLPVEKIVDEKLSVKVFDGKNLRQVSNWFKFENRDIYRVITKRGYELCGSDTHRILDKSGNWIPLSEVKPGCSVKIQRTGNVWPQKLLSVAWTPQSRVSMTDYCKVNNISLHQMQALQRGEKISEDKPGTVAKSLDDFKSQQGSTRAIKKLRKIIKLPKLVTKELSTFLGLLAGDGHISEVNREVGFTNGEEFLADLFVKLTKNLFGLDCAKTWDDTSLNGRWRVKIYSVSLIDFLKCIGMKTGVSARIKSIPDVILQSPKSVVSGFLRGLFDSDGCAHESGVILSSSSPEMVRKVQTLLLNYGILCSIYAKEKDNYHLSIGGESIKVYYQHIGFNSPIKQKALCNAVYGHPWFKKQSWEDEVVKVEKIGTETVYDITVDKTHRYAAQGFVNHNSFVDFHLLCEEGMVSLGQPTHDAGIWHYADHKWRVLGGKHSQNPYKLGFELLMDIRDRWNKGKFGSEWENCQDMQTKEKWNKNLGLGMEKLFEVRKHYNDYTLINEFFTPEFCRKKEFFEWQRFPNGEYKIINDGSTPEKFAVIKNKLLQRHLNGGLPDIRLVDPNHLGKGWFFMEHYWDGRPIYDHYARETLCSMFRLWQNNVVLATKDRDGQEFLYVCNGSNPSTDIHVMLRSGYEKEFIK